MNIFGSTRTQQEGVNFESIGNGSTVQIPIGCSADIFFLDVRMMPFLRFGFFYDQPMTLDLVGSIDNFTNSFTFDSIAIAASTEASVYNFPAPKNENGLYVLPYPFFAFQLTNTGAAPTTVQRCYIAVSNFRG